MTSLYLIRHGECEGSGLYIGRGSDPPLTEDGILQIKNAASWLSDKNISFSRLYSSPLLRAGQSAALVGEELGIVPDCVDELAESDFGRWEGLSYGEIQSKEPQLLSEWISDPLNNRPPGGESLLDVKKRTDSISSLWENEIDTQGESHILLVSHRGPIALIILSLLGLNLKRFWSIRTDRGSVSKLNLYPRFCELEYLNRTF